MKEYLKSETLYQRDIEGSTEDFEQAGVKRAMRKKYGDVIGFPADCSDEKLIKDLPEAINHILRTIENAAKENNGIIDMRSFQFVYHYHDEYDGPLGIEYLGQMCKATIGVKCDIEFPEEQDGQTE